MTSHLPPENPEVAASPPPYQDALQMRTERQFELDTRAALEASLREAELARPQPRVAVATPASSGNNAPMQRGAIWVTVPEGAREGQALTFRHLEGLVRVQVPTGAVPGSQFQVAVRPQPQPRLQAAPQSAVATAQPSTESLPPSPYVAAAATAATAVTAATAATATATVAPEAATAATAATAVEDAPADEPRGLGRILQLTRRAACERLEALQPTIEVARAY